MADENNSFDRIAEQRAIIKGATPPGPFVKGPRYRLLRGPGGIAEIEFCPDGEVCDVLTEEGGAPLYEAVPIADADFVIAASVMWPAALDELEQVRRRYAELSFETNANANPIPMLLWCPMCHARHVDVGEFATKSHKDHSCQSCGLTWRPAKVPTVGVMFLPGYKDKDPADVLPNRRNRCVAPGCVTSHHVGLADLAMEAGWVCLGDGWLCREHSEGLR